MPLPSRGRAGMKINNAEHRRHCPGACCLSRGCKILLLRPANLLPLRSYPMRQEGAISKGLLEIFDGFALLTNVFINGEGLDDQ